MNEGDVRSQHASGDYRALSCSKHVALLLHVWPHHVDDTVNLIPTEIELSVNDYLDRIFGRRIE
jgi:hypothetical protein